MLTQAGTAGTLLLQLILQVPVLQEDAILGTQVLLEDGNWAQDGLVRIQGRDRLVYVRSW